MGVGREDGGGNFDGGDSDRREVCVLGRDVVDDRGGGMKKYRMVAGTYRLLIGGCATTDGRNGKNESEVDVNFKSHWQRVLQISLCS